MENVTFLELLEETFEISKLFLDNKFDECLEKCKARQESSMYHNFFTSCSTSVQALLGFDKKLMATAIEDIETCLVVHTRKYRKQTSGFFANANYDQYSDEEVHAELINNILLNLSSAIGVLYDQSFSGFVKAAYRMTTAYMGYKKCMLILKTRECWSHPRHRDHFESLLKHFFGMIQIVNAYMPPRLSRLIEFVGFSGRLECGLKYLETSFYIENTFGSMASSAALKSFYFFADYFYGLGNIKFSLIHEIYNDCVRQLPKCAYLSVSKSLFEMVDSRFHDMVATLEEINLNDQPQFNLFVVCWLKSWGYAFLCDWNNAQKNMKQLLICPWAPAMFHYVYGSILFFDKCLEDVTECEDEISQIFEKVPSLRMKIGGRKVFHDDFVENRSKKYFGKSRKYFLPVYELFYIWNYFSLISKNKKSLDIILGDIESKLQSIDDIESHYDDYSVLKFLKAVVLKHSQEKVEAKKLFLQIIDNRKKLKEERFVVPHSMYEIGLIYKEHENVEESIKWIQKARKDHGYVTERLLSFRCDLLLRQFAD